MNINQLIPPPVNSETFKRDREKYIPKSAGCYALTTFTNEVLYIGLTNNLRRKMNEHLDNPNKTKVTELGRAVLFYWLESEDTNKVERTWLNTHIQNEGVMPILNSIYSPTSV
jgi:hypothetical protein